MNEGLRTMDKNNNSKEIKIVKYVYKQLVQLI